MHTAHNLLEILLDLPIKLSYIDERVFDYFYLLLKYQLDKIINNPNEDFLKFIDLISFLETKLKLLSRIDINYSLYFIFDLIDNIRSFLHKNFL